MSGFWRFDNLERITGGDWLLEPGDYSASATGLSHDTRTLTPGQIYLAVKGENHDGHRFVGSALESGAAVAIVSDEAAIGPGPVLHVDDTVAALQELASAYRDELAKSGCKIIAVCGSNGKTTTRHLLHHVLTHCGFRGTQSPKSFNNHLGVPLTLLAAHPDHDFVACEIGTNHPGEIASLGDIAWPDAAIITSIGREHLEHFKTLDGVAKEEAAILPYVRPNGFVTMPAAAAGLIAPYYDVQEGVVVLPVTPGSVERDVPEDFPLLAEHNRTNAALVVALSRWLGLPDTAAHDALRCTATPPGRLEIKRLGQGVTLIDDSYNANPDSMRAALDVLASFPGRKVAILGDMLEVGEAKREHEAIGKYACQLGVDFTVCIGRESSDWIFKHVCKGPTVPPSECPAWRYGGVEAALRSPPALQVGFLDQLAPGDTILLKGSRGIGLERIIPAIRKRFGEA